MLSVIILRLASSSGPTVVVLGALALLGASWRRWPTRVPSGLSARTRLTTRVQPSPGPACSSRGRVAVDARPGRPDRVGHAVGVGAKLSANIRASAPAWRSYASPSAQVERGWRTSLGTPGTARSGPRPRRPGRSRTRRRRARR